MSDSALSSSPEAAVVSVPLSLNQLVALALS
jgi:hypothetical protein